MTETKAPRRKHYGVWLCILGVLLCGFAAVMLWQVPSFAQYAVRAPQEALAPAQEGEDDQTAQASALWEINLAWEEARAEIGETVPKLALAAAKYGCDVYTQSASSQVATVRAVGAGYFSVYPKFLTDGRLPSEEEMDDGKNVIVLDEQLAFKLFPTTEALDQLVTIEQQEYRVIGVVRHTRAAGDVDAFGAYIPIKAAAQSAFQADILVAAGNTGGAAGKARAVFETAQTALGDGGEEYNLSKEVMRVTMLPRVLLVVFSLHILLIILHRTNRRVAAAFENWRAQLKARYLRDLLPGILKKLARFFAEYALILLAGYAVLRLTIKPMYVFTEWIPDVIVEWSSIWERVQALLVNAAKAVTVKTPEMVEIRLYGGVLRWGIICLLCGTIMHKRGKKEP